MLTAIVFIITLGILIFVHELGHFVVARRNGIKAEEFGFGFPPRFFGMYKGDKSGNWKFVFGNRNVRSKNTIYSLNWIPLGGFVKIKGEDGGKKNEPDSFGSKSAWARIKVLAAGVFMNFILAWILISFALMIGAPQAIEDAKGNIGETKIQVSGVSEGSPAEGMGLKVGDEIIKCVGEDNVCRKNFSAISDVQEFLSKEKGNEVVLEIKRGETEMSLSGVPRVEFPEDQGPLGISIVQTAIVSFPWHRAFIEGFLLTLNLVWAIVVAFGGIIKSLLIGQKAGVDVAGPVGIVYFTKQVTELGFVYILQFIALLSINLGIINGLPIPALDGGRILFILIEKAKGSPVSEKIESTIHTVGFVLLIALMIFVTFRDIIRFDVIGKFTGLF